MNKVVYVKAHFQPIIKEVTRKIETGETKKGLFGGEKKVVEKITEQEEVGFSKNKIDGERLSRDISSAVQKLNAEGYEVIAISETISGDFDSQHDSHSTNWAWGAGWGYSYTEGVTIIARQIS